MRPNLDLEVLADPGAVAGRVAAWMCALASAPGQRFAVALSGGTTPRRLYQCLAEPAHLDRFPWARTHWFWGDERFVPPQNSQSNFGMVQSALLGRAPVPRGNVHPIPTESGSPEAAASQYEQVLKSFYGENTLDAARPLFDLTLLGLGPDGHTASLFPGDAGLRERERWAIAVADAKGEPRITLTYPALESSRNVAFVVTGKEKAAILARFCRGDETLPAARLQPVGGLRVFADAAAAGDAA
jgi:6-phosphogluconolactonase